MVTTPSRNIDPSAPEPGEIEAIIVCGTCDETVANLWGRPRSDAGGTVRTYEEWGGEYSGEPDAASAGQYILNCRSCKQRFEIPSENLVVAGLDALDRHDPARRVVRVPEDVTGEIDKTDESVSSWKFLNR
jgi:hypothetical protein